MLTFHCSIKTTITVNQLRRDDNLGEGKNPSKAHHLQVHASVRQFNFERCYDARFSNAKVFSAIRVLFNDLNLRHQSGNIPVEIINIHNIHPCNLTKINLLHYIESIKNEPKHRPIHPYTYLKAAIINLVT